MTPLTLVMEADMLSLQLESSWHPDSETQQSEPPNPPGDRERGHEVKEEKNQKEREGERHLNISLYYPTNILHTAVLSCTSLVSLIIVSPYSKLCRSNSYI